MSRIYNPPTTSFTNKMTSSTTRPTSSVNVFTRASSVAMATSKDAGKMTRQQSAAPVLPSGSDPLRLVKVDTNPLVDKAKQTLTLLEQQNEWKNERRKEIAEGVKDPPADQNDWESSLSKWKNRRRSEPTYQPKVIDLIVDKIDLDKVDTTQHTSKRSNGRESLSRLHHQLMYDDDTADIPQSDSKTQQQQPHQHQHQHQQQQPAQSLPRESHGSLISDEKLVSARPSGEQSPSAKVQQVAASKTVTSAGVPNINIYAPQTDPDIDPDIDYRRFPLTATSQVTADNHVPKHDGTLNPVAKVTPVTSVTPMTGHRETAVVETRPGHLLENNATQNNNNQYNNATKNIADRATIQDNKLQLSSKHDEETNDSSRLADHERCPIVAETVRTETVSLSITLQSPKEITTPRIDNVTVRGHVTGGCDVTTDRDRLAEEADVLDNSRPAADERLTQPERRHRDDVDETFRVAEDRTRPEILGPAHNLAITNQNCDLIDLGPSSLSTSPPPDSPPPLPSVPPPSLRWTMFPSTVNETTDFDYDAESSYDSPGETIQFGLKTVF